MNKQAKKIMALKTLLVLTTLLSLCTIFSAAATPAAEMAKKIIRKEETNPWKVWRADDYLKVSYRVSDIKDLIEIRAHATLESSIAGFIYFIEDLKNTSNWLDNADSVEIIKQISANELIFVTRFKGLWPISAREMVVHSHYWQNQDLSLEISVKDASDAMVQTKNAIRMQVVSAHWKVIPTKANQIAISYQFIVDPKGNIPQWLTKPMTLNGIWTTLNNIREQLPNSKWQHQTNANIQEIPQ